MSLRSINPATGELLGTFEEHTSSEVDARVAKAHNAWRRWRTTAFAHRATVMVRAAELLETERRALGELMTREMGKPVRAAMEEAAKCATACRYYAEHAERHLSRRDVRTEDKESFVLFQPIGIVLAVMPWNFPFWQVFRFAAPALMAGNVGLLKHASNVPQCAIAIEDVLRRAGVPDGVFQTLLVGSKAVGDLIADPRVAAVTLTGSEGAGRDVGSRAGQEIKKSVLELGGSDAFIIMPSAPLDDAVATAVRARTVNNGQSCIAAKRFIVHERIFDDFARRFTRAMHSLRVGDPLDERTEIGPLATPQILEDLDDQVRRTLAAGARILTGGRRLERPGNFYEPTVLTDVPDDSPAAREELFGPVAPLLRARDASHALALANATTFGLGAAVWTTDANEIARFVNELEAGTVAVNGMVASDARLPFGGVKRSGYGRELSEEGIREFVNVKTVRVGAVASSRTE
ncbi:MAG TPA: NAD-dependent succinate-semialdehyde dehydrogenase [Gemmatimonadaceae bacterium]|nr:NAD-dependent succinate-semialdehyde dehydrogenase [Gemmatimonadaceae bacterium]